MVKQVTYGREAGSAKGPRDHPQRNGWLLLVLLLLIVLALLFFTLLVPFAEGRYNTVSAPPPYPVPQAASDLHSGLFVADLHADSLLWSRDLLERGSRGHVDVPRLTAGNVALQVFSLVNRVPFERSYAATRPGSDAAALLAVAGRWPLASWGSPAARVLHQAEQLGAYAERSGGDLSVVAGVADLHAFFGQRRRSPGITAGLLAVEGADALEGKLVNVNRFFGAGVRMLGLVHFLDNEVGGSAHGMAKHGLTPFGRDVVLEMQRLGMVVDLAHASEALFDDVLALATRPVVVSHTGVQGTCAGGRNLSDRQLRAISANGGLVGIGYWPAAVCGDDAQAIARAIRHAVEVAGARHVGLGSDFDGAVSVPFDASGVARVTAALLDEGLSRETIRLVMGGNAWRVLLELLPNG